MISGCPTLQVFYLHSMDCCRISLASHRKTHLYWIWRVSGYYLIHSRILVCIWYNKILLVFCPSSHLSSCHVYQSLAISILIFYTDSCCISPTSHHKACLYWIWQVSGCYIIFELPILICIWYNIHTAWSRKWKLISCVRSNDLAQRISHARNILYNLVQTARRSIYQLAIPINGTAA